jgi:hypothetical protein
MLWYFENLRKTTFQKLDLFLSSGEGGDTFSVETLRESYSQSLDQ